MPNSPGHPRAGEGPYGAFTSQVRIRRSVLLIGGGIGVTPIRALLEELTRARDDIVVIYRVHHPRDAVLLVEMQQLARDHGAVLHVVTGPSTATGSYGPVWDHGIWLRWCPALATAMSTCADPPA